MGLKLAKSIEIQVLRVYDRLIRLLIYRTSAGLLLSSIANEGNQKSAVLTRKEEILLYAKYV